MSQSLYIAAVAPQSGKSLVALGVMDLLARSIEKVRFFRPVIQAEEVKNNDIELIRPLFCPDQPYESAFAITQQEAQQMAADARETELFTRIFSRFKETQRGCEFILCEGTDFVGDGSAYEFEFNAQVARHLGCPVLIVTTGHQKSVEEVVSAARAAREEFIGEGCTINATIVNRAEPADVQRIHEELAHSWPHEDPVYVVPEHPTLMKPTLEDIVQKLGAKPIHGDQSGLMREVMGTKIAAMELSHYLDHIEEGDLIISPGDRADIILGSVASAYSENCPAIVGMILTGGMEPHPQVAGLMRGLDLSAVPLYSVPDDTYQTAMKASAVRGGISHKNERKVAAALGLFESSVPVHEFRQRLISVRSTNVTPIMFEHELIERAKANIQRIVLPEATDERILRAAEILLRRGVAEIILLGDEAEVHRQVSTLGLELDHAKIIDPATSELNGEFAHTYYELRKHKGIVEEHARDLLRDVSYFGTMMVYRGLADGMVSGAAHTTAHTIRPSFEFIRTRPGVSIVSSVFFMCLADRVLVYGDCAVNPNPTAEQLADIAVSSAHTAAMFGVEPRVAMLSYSTGASGTGADVERVRAATRLAREKAPELKIEGPIQYDAAIDASVAKTKMPDSEVAGRATVFIFPDLNTGNNTYKAVQRSAGAVAIGPVLQGLNKPVNDLSRGCLVPDIVNTVAITAIQAQNMESAEAANSRS